MATYGVDDQPQACPPRPPPPPRDPGTAPSLPGSYHICGPPSGGEKRKAEPERGELACPMVRIRPRARLSIARDAYTMKRASSYEVSILERQAPTGCRSANIPLSVHVCHRLVGAGRESECTNPYIYVQFSSLLYLHARPFGGRGLLRYHPRPQVSRSSR